MEPKASTWTFRTAVRASLIAVLLGVAGWTVSRWWANSGRAAYEMGFDVIEQP